MRRARQPRPAADRTDPELERLARDAFAELNDLKDDAPIILYPYVGDARLVDVFGTLWDGRAFHETYRLEAGGDLFIVRALGCRYRVVEGEYYHGRKRRYAAFLVN